MPDRSTRVAVNGSSITAVRTAPSRGAAGWTFVYAPGAGSNIDDPFGAYAARVLPKSSVAVVRFQFPYMEARRRSPDRPHELEGAWRAVIDAVRGESARLAVGGRSMGGRIASQVVAQGAKVDALALFAYPLHPPGLPERSRGQHLAAIGVRTLFCSGTNDAFASSEELKAAAAKVRRAAVYLLEGADHGFNVRRSSGCTREDVWDEALGAFLRWLA